MGLRPVSSRPRSAMTRPERSTSSCSTLNVTTGMVSGCEGEFMLAGVPAAQE
jgi:hypothetical protein